MSLYWRSSVSSGAYQRADDILNIDATLKITY